MAVSKSKMSTSELNEARGGPNNDTVGMDSIFNLNGEETINNSPILGLSTIDNMLISNFGDNEILNKFAEISLEAMKESKLKIDIHKLDKDKFDLGFSFIMYSHKGENNKVYYFLALLEKTGREPVTVKQVVEELHIKNSTFVLTTSDAFDDILFNKVESLLSKKYKGLEIIPLEGAVIPHTASVETTADVIAKFAHDVIATQVLVDTGKAKDINIPGIVKMLKRDGRIELNINYNAGITINRVGRSVRSDFNVESSLMTNNQMRGFHAQNGHTKLATATGYLEYVVGDETNPYTQQVKKTAAPLIVINEFMGNAPSINYALLGLINTAIFATHNVLYTVIKEKDAGPLNLLFNYGGEPTKYGEKISFKDPKADPAIVDDIIKQHIKQSPIFAVEVELYGADYSYLNAVSALNDPKAAELAAADIKKSASMLLGAEIMSPTILAQEPIIVPIGEYLDADGNVRDLREIDLAFICNYTNDPMLALQWNYSNMPRSICMQFTGKDPYILKLETIDKIADALNIRPVVTGKAVRVVLNAEFITEIVMLASSKGYNPIYNAGNIGYNTMNDLQSLSQIYAGASVGPIGFGVQNMPGAYYNSINMPMSARYHNGR